MKSRDSKSTHQISNAVALKHLMDLCCVVLCIHCPKGVDSTACCKHQPLCAARVHVKEVCTTDQQLLANLAVGSGPDMSSGRKVL